VLTLSQLTSGHDVYSHVMRTLRSPWSANSIAADLRACRVFARDAHTCQRCSSQMTMRVFTGHPHARRGSPCGGGRSTGSGAWAKGRVFM